VKRRVAESAAEGRQLRRTGGHYALLTMCVGVGQGIAAVLEAGRPMTEMGHEERFPPFPRNSAPCVAGAWRFLARRGERPQRVQAVMGWTPPRRPWCARVVVSVTTGQEASVSEASTIGLDLAKRVFQAHGADASGKVVFRKRLRREQVLAFFAGRPACMVAMEACSSAHYWAREIGELGHTVRLIRPTYVKPFVKRQKNDTTDAEAICEAAQRPTMRFVSVKSEAVQANAVVFRARPPCAAPCRSAATPSSPCR
jgi:hypothetical protein